jgi:hypothetical protein
MRVYIAGPMTKFKDQNYNFPAFYKAQGLLEMLGHEVRNPARADVEEGRVTYVPYEGRLVPSPEFTLPLVLRRDYVMIAECSAIVLLPGWQESVGANKELRVAREDFAMPAYELRLDASGWPYLEELK